MTPSAGSWDLGDHPTLRSVEEMDGLMLHHVPDGIRERRLAPEVRAAPQKAGVYRMLVPRAAGGDDVAYPLALRVIERLAPVDGSAASCAVIGAEGANDPDAGLRATGSHDVEATDVFVPAERTFELGAPDPRRWGP